MKRSKQILFTKTRNYLRKMKLMMIIYQFQEKESYSAINSLKYFIEYNDDGVTRPLCIKLPQMIEYTKHLDSVFQGH